MIPKSSFDTSKPHALCSGVKSVQAETFAAVAAEERCLSRDISEAVRMVAAIEAGNFSGGDRDPLDCDSICDDEDSSHQRQPSTTSVHSHPKSSNQTELPVEVS